jgi:hypothetical protein
VITVPLRRSLLSKAIAAFFVALIVLPFTAPFQTYDPKIPLTKQTAHDLNVSDKLAKDAGVAAFAPAIVFVAGPPAALAPRAVSRDVHRPVDLTVLRL